MIRLVGEVYEGPCLRGRRTGGPLVAHDAPDARPFRQLLDFGNLRNMRRLIEEIVKSQNHKGMGERHSPLMLA